MIVRTVALSQIPDRLLGIQKARVIARAVGKPTRLTNQQELNQEELHARVMDELDTASFTKASFNTDEEAARIGLMIDARGKGEIGVGIEGKEVFFWRREIGI